MFDQVSGQCGLANLIHVLTITLGNILTYFTVFSHPQTIISIFFFFVFLVNMFLLQNFPQFIVIHTVKGFGIVSKAENRCFSGTLLPF